MLWIKHVASLPGQRARRPQHPGVGPPKATNNTLSKSRFTATGTSKRVKCPRKAWRAPTHRTHSKQQVYQGYGLPGRDRRAWAMATISLRLKKGYLWPHVVTCPVQENQCYAESRHVDS